MGMTGLPEIDSIYRETRELYASVQPRLGPGFDHGFRILYAPPKPNPKALVLGFQPGGDFLHSHPEEHSGPPPGNEYMLRDWALASELRKRLSPEWVRNTTGSNVYFFCCPSISKWNTLDAPLREHIQTFCLERVHRIVALLRPDKVVVLGWDALEALDAGRFVEVIANQTSAVGRKRRRRLAAVGTVAGVPTVAIVHPSAGWKNPPVTDEDWAEIRRVVAGE